MKIAYNLHYNSLSQHPSPWQQTFHAGGFTACPITSFIAGTSPATTDEPIFITAVDCHRIEHRWHRVIDYTKFRIGQYVAYNCTTHYVCIGCRGGGGEEEGKEGKEEEQLA